MKHTDYYRLKEPERRISPPDPADIEDINYNAEIIDTEMHRLEIDKATKEELEGHRKQAVIDHPNNSVTDEKIGIRTIGAVKGMLTALFSAIGDAFKAIKGTENWNDEAPTTLTGAKNHMDDEDNPHGVTKAQVGLGNADNTSDVDKPVSTAQAAAIEEAQAALQDDISAHAERTNNPHKVTKAQVGLGSVTDESKETMFRDPIFTGRVTLDSTFPTEASQAVHKQYVDESAQRIFSDVEDQINEQINGVLEGLGDIAEQIEAKVDKSEGFIYRGTIARGDSANDYRETGWWNATRSHTASWEKDGWPTQSAGALLVLKNNDTDIVQLYVGSGNLATYQRKTNPSAESGWSNWSCALTQYNIEQQTGQNEGQVMSQKAVTDALNKVEAENAALKAFMIAEGLLTQDTMDNLLNRDF